jgi:hypothetical protein
MVDGASSAQGRTEEKGVIQVASANQVPWHLVIASQRLCCTDDDVPNGGSPTMGVVGPDETEDDE